MGRHEDRGSKSSKTKSSKHEVVGLKRKRRDDEEDDGGDDDLELDDAAIEAAFAAYDRGEYVDEDDDGAARKKSKKTAKPAKTLSKSKSSTKHVSKHKELEADDDDDQDDDEAEDTHSKVKIKSHKSKRQPQRNDDDDDDDDDDQEDAEEEEEHAELELEAEESSEAAEGTKQASRKERIAEQQRRTVFVGQLPAAINEAKLKRLMRNYGKIVHMNLVPPKNARAVGAFACAFIEYADEESALKALELHSKKLGTEHLRVNLAANRPAKKDNFANDKDRRTVYVGNLNFQTNEAKLEGIFKNYGVLKEVRLPRFHDSGLRRGFAMIEFAHHSAATRALEAADGLRIDGRNVVVQLVSDNKGTKEFRPVPEKLLPKIAERSAILKALDLDKHASKRRRTAPPPKADDDE